MMFNQNKYTYIKKKIKNQNNTFHFIETSVLSMFPPTPGRSSSILFLASLLHGIKFLYMLIYTS